MLQAIDAHILAASLRALASEVEANTTPAADLCNTLDRLAAFLADAAKDVPQTSFTDRDAQVCLEVAKRISAGAEASCAGREYRRSEMPVGWIAEMKEPSALVFRYIYRLDEEHFALWEPGYTLCWVHAEDLGAAHEPVVLKCQPVFGALSNDPALRRIEVGLLLPGFLSED